MVRLSGQRGVFRRSQRVPAENLLGGVEETEFKCVMSGLNNTRLTAAAGALGVCQGLINESVKYARTRIQFGQAVGKFQMIQEELARMKVETEAARLLIYKAAAQKDAGYLENVVETVITRPSLFHWLLQTLRLGHQWPTDVKLKISSQIQFL